MAQTLTVSTYNVKHFKEEKIPYCREVMKTANILFLQEHCLYNNTMDDLLKIGCVNYVGTSAMNEQEIRYGRPFGGCAVIWQSNLMCEVEQIDTDMDRICAVKMIINGNVNILLLNLHLPCDSRSRDENFYETIDILNRISCIKSDQNWDMIIIGGDFNADMTRNTPHVNAVKNFIACHKLHNGLDSSVADVYHTFESAGTYSFSLIDHILICENLAEKVIQYSNVESANNLSDHSAIICSFKDIMLPWQFTEKPPHQNRSAWHKATPTEVSNYKATLDLLLQDIEVNKHLTQCMNYSCENHHEELDELLSLVVKACIQAEDICIPKTTHKHKRHFPGWNEEVLGLQKAAIYWHTIWKEAGRPQSGDIAENRRASRQKYHSAIKQCKIQREHITTRKIAENLANNKSRNFWKEINRLKGTAKNIPTTVE